MAAVQWLLVLALLVVHSKGQSEGITGFVDNSTLTEWGQFDLTSTNAISDGFSNTAARQFVFPGLRFRCSGNVTKWFLGAWFDTTGTRDSYPVLGIYRDRPGGGFADRVGATILVQPNRFDSHLYEFTLDPPLPFQTNDILGVFEPAEMHLRLQLLQRGPVPNGPAYRNYVPSNPPVAGVFTFDYARNTTEATDRLPLLAAEIESDDPDSADCTRDFISRDLVELLAPLLTVDRDESGQQYVFPSYNFNSDGIITSWTMVALKIDGAGRTRCPELQIWRRRSGDTYDKIASSDLITTAEGPNQLKSGEIDPPLQFQSGDVLGMYSPPDTDSDGTRLVVVFGFGAGPTYQIRRSNAPLSSVSLAGQMDTGNNRPLLALQINLQAAPVVISLPPSSMLIPVPSPTPATTPPTTTVVPSPANTATTTAIAVVVVVLVLAALAVIIIIVIACCVKRRGCGRKDTGAADQPAGNEHVLDEGHSGANTLDEPYYSNVFHQDTTKYNEAYGTTAITTEQNEAYAMTTAPKAAYRSTDVPVLQSNEAYATTSSGDTAAHEYDYIL